MIIKSDSEIEIIKKFILENEYLAFDIETTGLEPRKESIIGFGVSNSEEGYYIAHKEWDGSKLVNLVSFDVCVEILNLLNCKNWTGWNSSFEVRFCRHYFGVDLADSLWSEGMLAKHTVDEERPFALKEVAAVHFGDSATEEQKAMKDSIKLNGGNPSSDYYMADVDVLGKYCVQDCLLTYKLNDYYLSEVKKQRLERFYFEDEVMPLYKSVTIDMEDWGVKLDLDKIRESRASISEDIDKLEDLIQSQIKPFLNDFEKWYLGKEFPPKRSGEFAQYICKLADLDLPKTKSGRYSLTAKNLEALEDSIYKKVLLKEDYLPEQDVEKIQKLWWEDQDQKYMFNISSKDHLKRLFFEKLGEDPVSKTDKGNPQVDGLFLSIMKDKYDWANNIVVYNKLNKLKSTYMDRFLEESLDGVFYPRFFQHRTISGRYGSNLQQLPRPKEDGEDSELVIKYNNLIRKFFVSREGCVFIDSDYESLEPHVFAHVSNDDGLKDIFKKGHDFYSTIAIRTEGIDGVSPDKKADNYLGKVNKPLRQKAKAYCLGVPYGLGGYALSKKLNIDKHEGEKLVQDYLSAFPNLKQWMQDSFDACVSRGEVRSEAGRVRHMPKAPKIWYAHKDYILDNLKMWSLFHDNKAKYSSMKYLHREFKNYINNSRNFQIQSLAASITNRACIAINKELKRQNIPGRVVAQIHDQIVVEVPKKYAEKCKKFVQYLMENTYKLSIPLKAPAEIAKDFYEGH